MDSNTEKPNLIESIDSGSLDVDVSKFYFKVLNHEIPNNGNYKVYDIQYTYASLIPFFNNMMTVNPDECTTYETALVVQPIRVLDDCPENNVYWINTIQLFDTLMEYIDIWKNDHKNANYLKEQVVQTGNIEQLLKLPDLKFINKFVNTQLDLIHGKDKKKYINKPTIKKYHTIACINPLLKMVSGFLQIECLTRKLNTYIATILWNCSMLEISEVSEDPIFKQLQENAIKEWNRKNDNKIDMLSEGNAVVGNIVNVLENEVFDEDHDTLYGKDES